MSTKHTKLINELVLCLREVLSYYLRGFEFAMLQGFRDCYAMLCLPSTRPSSYCVHRAIRTIAIYTVTSAVTLPLMLPTKSLTSLCVCRAKDKKNKKKSETLPSSHRMLWQVISPHQHGLPWSVSVTALSGPLLAVFPCNRS